MIVLILGLILFALANTLVTLVHGLRHRWWYDTVGRHLMIYISALGLELMGLICLALRLPVPLWVYGAIYAGVAFATLHRNLTIWRRQHELREPSDVGGSHGSGS